MAKSISLISTNGATADGFSTNSVRATLTDFSGSPVNGKTITLYLTGTAKFVENNRNIISKVVDHLGETRVQFTNTTNETVTVFATHTDEENNNVFSYTEAKFNDSRLLRMETTSQATADGKSTNSATTMLGYDGYLMHRHEVTLHVTGSAKFTDTGANTTTQLTNIFGAVTVEFTNTVAETVMVSAQESYERPTLTVTRTSSFFPVEKP